MERQHIVVVPAIESSLVMYSLLFGIVSIFCDSVAPVHKVQRRMVLSKTYSVRLLEVIFMIDLRKSLYASESLHNSERVWHNARKPYENLDLVDISE